ncbi:MAG TPA: hypothetical protein VFX93_04965, partial [Xanthomonadaceae bacterium]|nr:hypothetical protein [Xanthomonadaceae bacterium]
FPARWPLLPLDRMYLRNLQVHEVAVLSSRPWSHLSDHATLFARVGIDATSSVAEGHGRQRSLA